ncbi:hypothetical protein V5799_003061 [Amblyomma americanum]|uniref:Uncharacterized protein n=1 Tax=Amblyomma americanum TaxID=6943 RepID=A0AAQ4DA11_AMBAM
MLVQVLLLTGFYYQPPVSPRCLPDSQDATADWILHICNCCTDYLYAPLPFLEAFNILTWQHATISADEDSYMRRAVFTVPLSDGTADEMTRHSPAMLFQALLLTGFYYLPPVSPRCLPDSQDATADWILHICNRCTDYLCAPQPFLEAFNILTWQHATISADEDSYIRRAVFTVPLSDGTAEEMTRHSPLMLFQALLLTGFYYQPPVSTRCLPNSQAATADWILHICNRCTDYLCAAQPFLEAFNILTWQHATISADEDSYMRRAVFTVPLSDDTADEMTRHSPAMLFQALLLTGFYYQPPVSSRRLPDPQPASADWILDICNRCTDCLCAPQPFLEAVNFLTWQHATISADKDTYIRRAVFTVPLSDGTADEMTWHSPLTLFQELLLTGFCYQPTVLPRCLPDSQDATANWILHICNCCTDYLYAPQPFLEVFNILTWQHARISAYEDSYMRRAVFTVPLSDGTAEEMTRHSPLMLFQALLLTGFYYLPPVSTRCLLNSQSCHR